MSKETNQSLIDETAKKATYESGHIITERTNSSKRKFLIYGAAAAGVIAFEAADIYFGLTPLGKFIRSQFSGQRPPEHGTTTTTLKTTTVSSYTETVSSVNPVVKYALDKGIDPEVANRLDILKELSPNRKTLVDYLFATNNFVRGEKNPKEAVKSLQLKVLYREGGVSGILTDGDVSDEEAHALSYLAGFDSETQKGYIEFGLAPDVSNYLSFTSSFPDQDFAKYAVQNRVSMRTHHNLSDTEITYLTQLDKSYSNNPEAVEELTRLPDLIDVDERDLAAVDDILFLVDESKDKAVYQKAFASILSEGIRGKIRYYSPLEALLWIAYDQDFHRNNPLQGYSLERLMHEGWRQSSTSKKYLSDRWKKYDEAMDRVNSPKLVNMFINDYLTYDWSRMDVHPQGPRLTYAVRRGVCRHAAYISTDFLSNNGYVDSAKNVTVIWGPNEGHTVSTVELGDDIWIVVDFRDTDLPMKGPFKFYRDVELYLAQSFGKKISESYVESNYATIRRNNDLE